MKEIRVLVSRTDQLGDVLFAMPTLQYLRKHLPEVRIDFLVKSLYVDVLAPYLTLLNISPVLNVSKPYTHHLALFCERSVVWKSLRTGVQINVGNYSKLWSFFLFSRGIWQGRSQALKNEAEYNLDLAQLLLKMITGSSPAYLKPKIEIPKEKNSILKAIKYFREMGVNPESCFQIFHPGMRGSALNLSPMQYLGLVDHAEKNGVGRVILSIGPAERDHEVARTILSAKPYLKVVRGIEISVLREVFRMARLVVAPSTGPLHLAHYVGTRTIGLYSPVKTQNVIRWAPWGGSGLSSVYFPQVDCPGKSSCVGARCENYHCMEKRDWTDSLSLFSELS